MKLRVLVTLLAAIAISCASTPSADTEAAAGTQYAADPAGNYTLKTIDGKALPMRPVDPDRPAAAGPGPLVVGGSLIIEPDGAVRYVLDFRSDDGKERAIRMNASLRRDGDRLVVVWPNGARTPATYDGRRFTIDNLGMVLAFERAR